MAPESFPGAMSSSSLAQQAHGGAAGRFHSLFSLKQRGWDGQERRLGWTGEAREGD